MNNNMNHNMHEHTARRQCEYRRFAYMRAYFGVYWCPAVKRGRARCNADHLPSKHQDTRLERCGPPGIRATNRSPPTKAAVLQRFRQPTWETNECGTMHVSTLPRTVSWPVCGKPSIRSRAAVRPPITAFPSWPERCLQASSGYTNRRHNCIPQDCAAGSNVVWDMCIKPHT